MCLRPFGLYCSACSGILFVSILCMCCSHFSWYCFIFFTIFSAVIEHKMSVLISPTTLSEIFLIRKRNERDVIINVQKSSCKVQYRYSCKIKVKVEFYRQILEKDSNIKFHKNPFSWSRVVPRGRTDGQRDRKTRQS